MKTTFCEKKTGRSSRDGKGFFISLRLWVKRPAKGLRGLNRAERQKKLNFAFFCRFGWAQGCLPALGRHPHSTRRPPPSGVGKKEPGGFDPNGGGGGRVWLGFRKLGGLVWGWPHQAVPYFWGRKFSKSSRQSLSLPNRTRFGRSNQRFFCPF